MVPIMKSMRANPILGGFISHRYPRVPWRMSAEHFVGWRVRKLIRQVTAAQLARALKDGLLVKSKRCERCGKKGARGSSKHRKRLLQGHHADYAHPLRVEWLCPGCHSRHHAAERGAAMRRSVQARRAL